MKHIEYSQLIEKFERRMIIEQERILEGHLEECGTCRNDLRRVETFFTYVQDPGNDPVPQAATANILNIYQRRPAIVTENEVRIPGKAFLIFDDWTMAVNERFSGVDTRQLLFEIDEYTIDLRLELRDEYCKVSGQIFPDSPGSAISFVSPDSSVSTVLSDLSEFSFASLAQGSYDIEISIGNQKLLIPKVPLMR